MTSARFATLLPIVAVLAACSGAGEAERTVLLERDSAFIDGRGQRAVVHIVASSEPVWPTGAGWRVAATPRLVLDGRAAGGAPFGRVTGAARRPDGGVIVADAGAQRLRLFDATGRAHHVSDGAFAGTAASADVDGHIASGFPGIGGVALRGDTVLALDAPATVVRFGADGARLDAAAAPLLDRFGRHFAGEYVRLLADGTLLAWLYEQGRAPRPDGAFRPTQGFVRLHPGSAREDTIGWYDGLEHVQAGGVARWAAFGADSYAAADAHHIFVGDSRSGAVHVHDYRGVLHRVIQVHSPEVKVTARDVEAYRAAFRARVLAASGPAAVASYEQLLATLPAARVLPAFQTLLVDAEGNLWVETFTWPAGREPTWRVFDPDGRWLGDVATPRGLTLVEIGADYLLGVRAEAGEPDRVELYELRTSSGSGGPDAGRGVAGR